MHDIQQEYYPEFFSFRERVSRWASYRLSCWAATSIQVSSLFVKECIIEKFPFVIPDKIFVAYEGVDFEKFSFQKKTERPSAIDLIQDVNFIFYPAQLWLHKNHMMLFDALALFRDENGRELPCVLTGQNYGNWNKLQIRVNELKLKQVFYLGRVSFEQLLWLYQNCSAVLALGLHESSSLPVREGAVFGKPLICSNIPPNIEAQEFLSLILVDCYNPRYLAEQFHKVVNGMDDIKEGSFQNIDRVRVFDWNLIAKKYLAIIRYYLPNDSKGFF
jgi:glycosyltransferase involved in cell wall biosynthesis